MSCDTLQVISGCEIAQVIELDAPIITTTVISPVNIAQVLHIGPPGPDGPPAVAKSGIINGASFSGSPKKYTVVFADAYADTNYVIAFGSNDGRIFTYESKTINGFVINANASTAISGEVSWITTPAGETS